MKKWGINMTDKRCQNCGKYRFCNEEKTDIKNCEKWIRQPYMYLKEYNGFKWEFERID